MARHIQILEKLEKDLNLKQLQIKSLLTITQAINDNVPAEGLFNMYKSFLSWEMGIEKMILVVKDVEDWVIPAEINANEYKIEELINLLLPFQRMYTVKESDDIQLQSFDIIIPVYHKEFAIAYALIGGIRDKDDLYNKIQFITTITNIIAVAIENKRLFKKQLRQAQLEKELELASEVQKMLMPKKLIINDSVDLDYVYKPHNNIGGDYIDVIQFSKDRFALCIADISGKGVAAALLMANFQAMLHGLIFQYRDLETFIYALNESVYRITQSDRFLTFFIADIDCKKRELRYINSGHFPPYLKNGDDLLKLDEGSTVIGAFEKLPAIKEEVIQLKKNASIFCFTDGLTDIQNDKEVFFEEEILEKFVKNHLGKKPSVFNNLLMEKIESYRESQEYVDDIALITGKL